jgi:hypothetical protein
MALSFTINEPDARNCQRLNYRLVRSRCIVSREIHKELTFLSQGSSGAWGSLCCLSWSDNAGDVWFVVLDVVIPEKRGSFDPANFMF